MLNWWWNLCFRTKGFVCHLVYSFIFWMRKLRMRDVKELTWKCIVWPLLVLSCLVDTVGTTTLLADSLPDCLVRVWEHARTCLDMFLTSDTTTLFSREEWGFFSHCGQYGDILWKWTCERLSQVARCCQPADLEEWLIGGSPCNLGWRGLNFLSGCMRVVTWG